VSDSSSSLSLVWIKVNDWLMETECRNFRCRKLNVGEITDEKGNVLFGPPTIRYQLYGPNGIRLGPPCESFRAAREYALPFSATAIRNHTGR
jgi:hypothetical protein